MALLVRRYALSLKTQGGAQANQLRRVQEGLEPDDYRPLPSVGPGVQELRIHTNVEHRVVYVVKFAEALYVLHAFQKKEQRMSQSDLDLARKRYQEVRSLRGRDVRPKGRP